MRKFIPRIFSKTGAAPGTLTHIDERKDAKTGITLMNYSLDRLDEQQYDTIEEALASIDSSMTTWLNIDGVHDTEIIEKIGRHFNINVLTLEDIVHTGQRPKVEEYNDYLYFALNMLHLHEDGDEIRSEQVSLVLKNNFLLSFQEARGDVFEPVRERMRKGKGKIRTAGSDYLTYALIDAVVDHYFVILEVIGGSIEALEEELLQDSTPDTMREIHAMRGELLYLRKQVWPLREMISRVTREELPLIHPKTGLFFRDVYDHIFQIIDTIESYRDVLSGMRELHLSILSTRTNEVMKVLTMIATIFIPITFIAGIYGMNFKFMPELSWRWGYATVWGVIITMVILLIVFFKRKKWF